MATSRRGSFSLTVPIEVSKTADTTAAVKVALVDEGGRVLQSQVVKTSGKPEATFELSEVPKNARVVIGPEDADDDSLPKLESVSAAVPSSLFLRSPQATLKALLIPPHFWPIWRRWCRDFVITGTVLCPNGRPVPGAQVCAFDVDWFWIWQSKQQIGCTTTDANGQFTLTFRWCCGWFPWWWWSLRHWQIDVPFAEEVLRTLPPELKVRPIPQPDPVPDLRMIESLIPQNVLPKNLRPQIPVPVKPRIRLQGEEAQGDVAQGDETREDAAAIDALKQTTTAFFERAELLRPVLANLLPRIPRIPDRWPWFPWYPWRDCNPDVIFTVKQFCQGELKVIVDQSFSETQWNIDESHSVTLIANGEACCAEETPCGDPCLSISEVCNIHRPSLDQTSGSPTAGYAFPGATAPPALPINYEAESQGDRPFAGAITVEGPAACMGEDVDWYEVESSRYNPITGTWSPYIPIPIGYLGAFTRTYFTGSTTPPYTSLQYIPTTRAGKTVYPSRKKMEATLPPHFCYEGCNILFVWLTDATAWPDGTYRLRLRPYKEQPAETLVLQSLPPCHPDEPNEILITLDNRPVLDLFHPASSPSHPCGDHTVHTCTTEPDVDIEAVRIIRADPAAVPPVVDVLPCGIYNRQRGDVIEIDFLALDSSEHLGYYTLHATYGENGISDLLDGPTPLANAAGVQPGPTYARALVQGAVAPRWRGGRITISVPASKFPDPCCYQLELRARKRPIVNCGNTSPYENLAEYSFFY